MNLVPYITFSFLSAFQLYVFLSPYNNNYHKQDTCAIIYSDLITQDVLNLVKSDLKKRISGADSKMPCPKIYMLLKNLKMIMYLNKRLQYLHYWLISSFLPTHDTVY